jgi:hypothetical protein
MPEPMQIFDDRATAYATGTDCWNILTDEMHRLYLLSFLLTADLDKAEQCFVSGMGEYDEEIGVFMTRMQAWARRTIVERAIRIIMPTPQRADDFSFSPVKGSAASGKTNHFDGIVVLNAFERFVYVMSVLEGLSDGECSALLKCSRRDVIIARELALERMANTHIPYYPPVGAVVASRTIFANHCA